VAWGGGSEVGLLKIDLFAKMRCHDKALSLCGKENKHLSRLYWGLLFAQYYFKQAQENNHLSFIHYLTYIDWQILF